MLLYLEIDWSFLVFSFLHLNQLKMDLYKLHHKLNPKSIFQTKNMNSPSDDDLLDSQ